MSAIRPGSRRPLLGAPANAEANPYASFWMAGFEGADHVNAHAEPQDLNRVTGHLEHLDDDYRRLAALGIGAVRESVGWRLAEPVGAAGEAAMPRFDLERTLRTAAAANRHGLQVLWTVMHYGFPRGVDVFADDFADRFAEFAGATARALRGLSERAPIYTPINEISFLAWAIAETNFIHPYHRESEHRQRGDGPRHDVGWEAKWRLIRAALRAMVAIRAEDPRARFLHVEPLTHVVPPPRSPHLAWRAEEISSYQWQAWDMLSGALLPELGGSAEALDLLGVNYYHNCQWEMDTGQRLEWHLGDPRRVSMTSLLRKASKRFERPLLIAETSHVGVGRALWLDDVACQVEHSLDAGVAVQGICLYPVIDRPDWNDANHWHNSGLWDLEGAGSTRRRLHFGYAKSLRRAQRRLSGHHVSETPMRHLIVFSHLRWSFVYQRPQHLLARLARHYHVVFVEEPVLTSEAPYLERTTPCAGIEVLRPHTPIESPGFHDEQLASLQPLIAGYLADNLVDDYAVWFYTPMALPLLNGLEPQAVVYDCMDELAAFKNAPRQLRQREAALLKSADLVLTGGPRLYESKRHANANVLCLPSAVDAKHYAAARATADTAAMQRADALQGGIAGPRLGFFGVIDERIDLELVARLADSDPATQIVMVGPVVKIDPAGLPNRPNIHWLGQQPYELLPQLVAGWQVCLMPFALNESTAFISPTKTLEYMAAGKPVVSTAVHDVKVLFGDIVAVADDGDAFIAGCRAALAESPVQAQDRRARMQRRVARYSWDETAATVHEALSAALDAEAASLDGDAGDAVSAGVGLAAAAMPALDEPRQRRLSAG